MNIRELLEKIAFSPEAVEFKEVMLVISEHYDYQPVKFNNGVVVNEAGVNEASCKIFYFGKLHNLDKDQTLVCFGKFYRRDVLQNPEGSDHENIRNFMVCAWEGIEFFGEALIPK